MQVEVLSDSALRATAPYPEDGCGCIFLIAGGLIIVDPPLLGLGSAGMMFSRRNLGAQLGEEGDVREREKLAC